MTGPLIIKKYSNRRLYDTVDSTYITLEELADRVRRGLEVRVTDAKTGRDLTQGTLAQIILESRHGADLLPVPLLMQLIRMGDDALAEFFGRYVTVALELYVQAKQGAQAIAPFNPFGPLPQLPFNQNPFAQIPFGQNPFGGVPGWSVPQPAPPSQPPQPPPPPARAAPASASAADVASLRKELDELKQALRRKK